MAMTVEYKKVEVLSLSQVSVASLAHVHDALGTGGVAHSLGQQDLYEEMAKIEEEPCKN